MKILRQVETFGGFLLGALLSSSLFFLAIRLLSLGIWSGLRQPVLLILLCVGMPLVAMLGGLAGTGFIAALVGRSSFRRTGRILSGIGYFLTVVTALFLYYRVF